MRRVLAKTHVTSNVQLGEQFAEFYNSLYDRTLRIIRQCSFVILIKKLFEMRALNTLPRTLAFFSGTPNSMTLRSPFWTSGTRNSSRRLTPHRFCPGIHPKSRDASSISVMKTEKDLNTRILFRMQLKPTGVHEHILGQCPRLCLPWSRERMSISGMEKRTSK